MLDLALVALEHASHTLDRLVERSLDRIGSGVDDQDDAAPDVGDQFDAMDVVLPLENGAYGDRSVEEASQVLDLGRDLLSNVRGILVVKIGHFSLHETLHSTARGRAVVTTQKDPGAVVDVRFSNERSYSW